MKLAAEEQDIVLFVLFVYSNLTALRAKNMTKDNVNRRINNKCFPASQTHTNHFPCQKWPCAFFIFLSVVAVTYSSQKNRHDSHDI